MRKMQGWAGLLMVGVLGAATVQGETPPTPPLPKIGIDLALTTGGVLDSPGPAIGGTFHLGQHFAFRPSVGYQRNQTHVAQLTLVYELIPAAPPNPEPPPRTLTSEQWTGGLEALYYFKRTPDRSPYVFASFDFWRQSYPDATELELEFLYLGAKRYQTYKSWRGGLGLQYAIKDKLALFGEIGLRHSSGDSDSQTSTFSSNVGVIFYLK